MADIAKFFEAFSERAYKENDLSDVTYAMCEADLKFRQFFLDFFFHESHLDAHNVTIEREHPDALGRPDFWIKDDKGVLYIVEVKIWDGNHHFEQYYNILSVNNGENATREDVAAWRRLGYIANYEGIKSVIVEGKAASELCCHVATWKEFVRELRKYDCLDDLAIEAYTKYVSNVCPFDDFTVVNDWFISTDDFIAIHNFCANITKAIECVGCKIYTRSSRRFRSLGWMGQFFEWETADKKRAWGWLGAYYRKSGAIACVEFEDRPGWGDLICARHRNDVREGSLRYYARNTNDVVQRAETLHAFLKSVLTDAQSSEHSDDNDIFCVNAVDDHLCKPLLAMKCLPFLLENRFIDDDFTESMSSVKLNFSFVRESDEEIPISHCGRHFILRKTDETGAVDSNAAPVCRGWIGMLYSGDCRYLPDSQHSEKSFADEPSFVVEVEDNFLTDKAKADWAKNTWGWRFRKIEDGRWEEVLKHARDILLTACKQSLS